MNFVLYLFQKGGGAMNERIRELRETLKKSQDEFAKELELSRNYISLVENGQRNLSSQSIKLLCSIHNVNEEWLRTGNGEMFIPVSKSDLIADMMSDVLKCDEDAFKRRLISALSRLDDDGWGNLERLIDMISGEK